MSTLSLRLPTSLHKHLGEVAKREGVSINQLINSAVAEKMAALQTEEYLAARAARGDRKKFDSVLAKIPDAEPPKEDQLKTRAPKRRRPRKCS